MEAGLDTSQSARLRGEPLHPVVYACTALLLLCLLTTAVTYLLHHSVILISRKGWHLLLNLCFSIGLTGTAFAGGIEQTSNLPLCQGVGILLHYASLSTVLWIGMMARNTFRQLGPRERPAESDEPPPPPRPIIRFYLIGGGIPILVCGITALVDINNYGSNGSMPLCWVAWEASLAAFYGPTALVVLATCVYLIRTAVCLHRRPGQQRYELKDAHPAGPRGAPGQPPHIIVVHPPPRCCHHHVASHGGPECGRGGAARCAGSPSPALANEHTYPEQLAGTALVLLLYAISWTLGALAAWHSDQLLSVVFSCLFGGTVLTLGLFVLVHHCAKRDDVWHLWFGRCCCCCRCCRRCCGGKGGGVTQAEVAAAASSSSSKLPHQPSRSEEHDQECKLITNGQLSSVGGGNMYVVVSGNPPSLVSDSVAAISSIPLASTEHQCKMTNLQVENIARANVQFAQSKEKSIDERLSEINEQASADCLTSRTLPRKHCARGRRKNSLQANRQSSTGDLVYDVPKITTEGGVSAQYSEFSTLSLCCRSQESGSGNDDAPVVQAASQEAFCMAYGIHFPVHNVVSPADNIELNATVPLITGTCPNVKTGPWRTETTV
ncbi:adhesion G protein-coupled receptor A1 [Petromyzon marinus]|uniref:adhesion G protein-coupled receptor A1 n=1 Tax=Petromyzon marinus TaxID=7757 RepID=UPI003F707FA0